MLFCKAWVFLFQGKLHSYDIDTRRFQRYMKKQICLKKEEIFMIIKKIMNNNVVFVKDKKKNELILVGSGIGFKMKPGMKADESKVEKTFLLSKFKEQKRLVELLSKISSEDFKLADHIIQYAKASLGTDLNENIYVTLTDHMVFAMERTRKGIIFRNALLWEIKQFYPQEFAIGQYAIEVIEKKTGIKMAEDEAGFIALHIANARSDGDIAEVEVTTKILKAALKIIKLTYQIELDEDSLDYSRFVVHMKYFVGRLMKKKLLDQNDPVFIDMIKQQYSKAFGCAVKIGQLVTEQYGMEINDDELVYLTIHIQRITNSISNKKSLDK